MTFLFWIQWVCLYLFIFFCVCGGEELWSSSEQPQVKQATPTHMSQVNTALITFCKVLYNVYIMIS